MQYALSSLVLLILFYGAYKKIFRHRKRRAREIVLIAMLCAITTVLNLLSFSGLPLQMGTAMVIISGISLGPEAGFLVGSLGKLVCNMFQGQGPWTLWQMASWGLLGVLAGIAFHKVDLEKKHERQFRLILGPVISIAVSEVIAYLSYVLWPLEGETSFMGFRIYVFGVIGLVVGIAFLWQQLPVDEITLVAFTFSMVFLVYGGIMNCCAYMTSAGYMKGEGFSLEALRLMYVSGVPYDFWHALRASIAVFLLGPTLIQKLERVKIKYGFYR